MASFTVFFCGTGSNSFDFAHTNFFKGELISTLAQNHSGHEFVDWIIVDGPGSGNLQEAEKWVPSKHYSKLRGTLVGRGWEENVKHAVAILVGTEFDQRAEHTGKEERLLRKMGVGVHEEARQGTIARALLGPTKNVADPLHARITPQALQQKKIEILGQAKDFDRVNVIGWSRGAVTCHMFANALAETPGWDSVPVNVFACDPVPGSGNFAPHRIALKGNVENYVAVYALDERSRGFTPVLPGLAASTKRFITAMPGRHATLVGNAAVDGSAGVNTLYAPGQVTRDLAERFLTAWGTPLANRLSFSDAQVLAKYEEMLGQEALFQGMQKESYVLLTQGKHRAVGLGDGTWSDFGHQTELVRDPLFVNTHHRAVFTRAYPLLCGGLFDNQKLSREQLERELAGVKGKYPRLHERLKGVPVKVG